MLYFIATASEPVLNEFVEAAMVVVFLVAVDEGVGRVVEVGAPLL